MSTVKEIEAAIQALPQAERARLVAELPSILPELDGDGAWNRLLTDPRPRPALSQLGDEIETQLQADPESIPEIKARDFDR